ncbi:MAG: TMEM143 family protein [Spirulinaceae cyanobacterium]
MKTSDSERGAFIPYRRSDLIKLCLEDGKLQGEKAQQFHQFCDLLSAFYHFKFHAYLERLKDNYAPFNPDSATQSYRYDNKTRENQLIEDFEILLKRANYIPVSYESLQQAIEERSLIDVQTKVDFEDFEQLVFYYRGDISEVVQEKKFFFRTVEKSINLFERVVVLIKFKEAKHFKKSKFLFFSSKDFSPEKQGFQAQKIYIYYYKNVPKFDMELLFPNIQTSMTWKDRLLFLVPAIGAAIPLAIKTLPKLVLVVETIIFMVFGAVTIFGWQINEQEVRDFMPVLTAMLSLLVVLGSFAFRQYSKYKSKLIRFRKNITDTLFFRNLANNSAAFNSLVDEAEEEECKEIILVYYHLLTSDRPLTPAQLDRKIETWMLENYETDINFDINGPIDNLEQITGDRESPLLQRDKQGYCQVLPLPEAKALIDEIWDNIFDYADYQISPKQSS